MFTPKWRHKDWRVRMKAIGALGALDDSDTLAVIAKKDTDWHVRRCAVEKIRDQSTLLDIAKNDEDPDVRISAIERIHDAQILENIYLNEKDDDVKKFLMSKLERRTPDAENENNGDKKEEPQNYSEPVREGLPAAVHVVLNQHKEHFASAEVPVTIFLAPEIKEHKVRNAKRAFQIPDDEKVLGLIDWTLLGSAKNGMAFCEHNVYGRSRDGSNTLFTITYRDIAKDGKLEPSKNSKTASIIKQALGDVQPPLRQQVEDIMARLQPICANYFPAALTPGGESGEQFLKDAKNLIISDDWNGLYTLAKRWNNVEPTAEIPYFILFAACHYTTPPKVEELINLDADSMDYKGQTLYWLGSIPDGKCRNIIYALVLSYTDIEASIRMLEDELETRPGPEACIALGISHQNNDLCKKYFDRAIELDGRSPLALQRRAEIAVEEGALGYAKDLLLRALNAQGVYTKARFDLANVYARQGHSGLRKEQLEEIIKIDREGIYGKAATEELNQHPSSVILKDLMEGLWFVTFSGVKGGVLFLFFKFAYGIYHDYGLSESLANLFTPNGVIVFGIGFVFGVVYPFFRS